MITTFYIEGQEIEQYKDENVNVSSSVASIKDITVNTTDYSNSFNVPASASNNQLFKHYYNATIDNTFDARKTNIGEIHIGGILFKAGKWQLQKVNIKQGKPESYTINFSGKLTSLKDRASSFELKDLDLSSFDHAYNSDNVLLGLTTRTLKSGDLVYNLFAKKQYYYNSDGVDNTQTETLANIAWDAGVDTGVIWNDLKPSLKVIRILEAIEVKLGIDFSWDFFGTSEFTELFMWLNNDDTRNSNTDFKRVDFDSGNNTYMNFSTDVGTYTTVPFTGVFQPTPTKFKLFLETTPAAGYENVDYKVKYYVDGELTQEWIVDGTNPITTHNTNEIIIQDNDVERTQQIYFEIESEQEIQYTCFLRQNVYFNNILDNELDTFASNATIESNFIVSDNIPEMKIIDFLKGLFLMYKLIIIPTSETEFYVDTLSGYYSKGNTYRLTKYIEWKNYDVERGKILNNINFSFQEPSTILNIEYEKNNGVGYGDEDLKLYTDSTETELLDGDSLDVELPFEQIVYERLRDLEDDRRTNIHYAAIVDESLNPVNPKPHLHYNGVTFIVNTLSVAFINDVGAKIEIVNNMNVMLHGDYFFNPSFTTTFDDTFSTWNNARFTRNLYTNHYQKFLNDIFNIKKRTFKFKAKNIPLHILTKLKLNDALLISGNYYRIDNFETRLLLGEVDFELVNIFDEVVNPIRSSTNWIYTGGESTTKFLQLTNNLETAPTKIDMGDGTTWITLNLSATVDNQLQIVFDSNATGFTREMWLTITIGTQTQNILLTQESA